MSATLFGIATLCKYSSDFLKLRKDRKSSEKNESIRDYIEACRRRDHAEGLDRLNTLGQQLTGFEQLLSALWDLTDEQGRQLLEAIETGNLSVLAAIDLKDAMTHAKLDQIIHLLGVEPRRLFSADPTSWRDIQVRQFEARYLDVAVKEFARLEMLGVPGTRDFYQDLDVAYVNLELMSTEAGDVGRTGRAHDVLSSYRQLSVRGPAGSGKTTLLRWIALKCAMAASDRNNPWHGGVPFFVPLRKLKGTDRGKPEMRRLHEYAFDAGLLEDPPNGWLRTVFDEGRAVLLLDGLDEMPRGARKNFWKWLDRLLYQHPSNRVFVTSRPLSSADEEESLEWRPPVGFSHCELRDLSAEDRVIFIQKWHEAVKVVLRDSLTWAKLDKSRDELLSKLEDRAYARVRDLCKNPLTAGLICALYWRELKLPESRRELYETSCNLLMLIRDEFREIKVDDPFAGVRKADRVYLAEALAWEMMQNARADEGQNIEVRERDAILWLKNYLPNCENATLRKAHPRQVLNFLIQRSGVLRVPSKGFIDFHHRSFQEYLAACAAAVLNQVVNLARKADDDQWRETIILAANTHEGGVTFGRALIRELLEAAKGEADKNKERVRIALAAACLENSEKPPADLRAEVESRLRKMIPPHSIPEGEAVAIGGEAVLKYFEFRKLRAKDRSSIKVLAACAAALSGIGTASARQMLLDPDMYGGVPRQRVWEQICKCPGVEPLDIPSVVTRICAPNPPRVIRHLDNFFREKITRLDSLGARTELTELKAYGWHGVSDASPLSRLINLRELVLVEFSQLSDVSFVRPLTKLTNLTFSACERLSDIGPVAQLTDLVELNLAACIKVSDLAPLRSLKKLTEIVLTECVEVTDLTPIEALDRLRLVIVMRCPQLQSNPVLRRLSERGVEVRGP
jgi:hypothetical protein